MSEWLARLAPRERLIVLIAVVVLVGLIIHALVFEPYQARLQSLQDELDQQQTDLEWMRTAVSRLPVDGAVKSTVQINGTLANFVDQTVRQQGLSSQLSSMSPAGSDVIRMRLSAVEFNRLMSFISQIYASGLQIRDVRITATGAAGQVDSNLVLFRS